MSTVKKYANLMPTLYSHRVHDIQEVCRSSGYAMALHGSMQRDIDVIAVPWLKNPRSPETLVKRMCLALGVSVAPGSPTVKNHGRVVYTLLMGGPCFMDLSIMPPNQQE